MCGVVRPAPPRCPGKLLPLPGRGLFPQRSSVYLSRKLEASTAVYCFPSGLIPLFLKPCQAVIGGLTENNFVFYCYS